MNFGKEGEIDEEKYLLDLQTPCHEIIKINNTTIYLGNQSFAGNPCDKWNYQPHQIEEMKNELKKKNIKTIVCCADNVKKL